MWALENFQHSLLGKQNELKKREKCPPGCVKEPVYCKCASSTWTDLRHVTDSWQISVDFTNQ